MGTRPEVVKLAPVVRAIRQAPDAHCTLVVTGQHRELADTMLDTFGLIPDHDLAMMRPNQDPGRLLHRMLARLVPLLRRSAPDLVLAQGDTTTVLATALASFHAKIPFGHVEAGLRSHDFARPFPEEMNRVLVSRLASLHFAPTPAAVENLLAEGVDRRAIHLTGNPVVDMLREMLVRSAGAPASVPGIPDETLCDVDAGTRPLLLVTVHRRESFGPGIRRICSALAQLARSVPESIIAWPVHPNPVVRRAAASLSGLEGIRRLPPLPYPAFVRLLASARVVLTDSGGVQEEAVVLGRPVVVLREVTERPEVLSSGLGALAGTDPAVIVRSALDMLERPGRGPTLDGPTPFGEGIAGRRIADIIRDWWSESRRRSS